MRNQGVWKGGLRGAAVAAAVLLGPSAWGAGDSSRLSDEVIPYHDDDDLPIQTAPIFELGDVFLRPGNIKPGFRLPGGAVWQPRFWVFGAIRSSIHQFDTGPGPKTAEWFNRADIFGNLQLSGTERALIGYQPLNKASGFTGYRMEPDSVDHNFQNNLNGIIRTAFFEGDFGEIFPGLDANDRRAFDLGFSVGRQPLRFQDGLLLDDTLDSVGITKNNLRIDGWDSLINLRLTWLYAWGEVGRNDNVEDFDARLYGLFTAWDTVFGNGMANTIEADIAFTDSQDDAASDVLVAGLGSTQRIGLINTTFRLAGSHATDRKTAQSNNGTLLFVEVSWTPFRTHNLLYWDTFWGNENFTSAARDTTAGGPLGRTGLLFAARGIGTYPAPLSNRPDEAFGTAIGYQMFFAENRRQLIIEAGGRTDSSPGGRDGAAISARLQQALGRRFLIEIEGFLVTREKIASGADGDGNGVRFEFQIKL